jgi:hypothetical protein
MGPSLRVCAIAALLLAASSAPAQQLGAFIDLGVSRETPSGTAFARSPADGSLFATAADYRSENSFSQIPSLRFYGRRYRLEASFRESSFAGSTTFGEGPLRPASAIVLSYTNLAVDHFSLGFRADVIDRPLFSVGLGTDIDRLRVESTVWGAYPTFTESIASRVFAAPVVTAGFNLHDPARRAFLDLKLGYSNFGSTELSKARAEAGYSVFSHAGLKAGWEGMRYRDGNGGGRDTDLKLSTFSGGFFFHF